MPFRKGEPPFVLLALVAAAVTAGGVVAAVALGLGLIQIAQWILG
jgi:hypothetical protein